ncbi:MAG: hypothetical protein JWO51_4683 [Rhodospirillales bacterium]|jgi:hypothetical protein|nr:hypothetical protein [Rhodospirillales bacterium]
MVRYAGSVALRQVCYHADAKQGLQDKMGVMGKVFLALAALIILVIVGGGLFLAYAPSTAPSQKVEKVLPDARFPR